MSEWKEIAKEKPTKTFLLGMRDGRGWVVARSSFAEFKPWMIGDGWTHFHEIDDPPKPPSKFQEWWKKLIRCGHDTADLELRWIQQPTGFQELARKRSARTIWNACCRAHGLPEEE